MELLNSMDFDDFDFLEDELEYILDENANKRCAFIAHRSSHYGAIGGNGLVGYRLTGATLKTDIMNTDAEHFRLYTEDDILKIDFYDHDGVHACEIVELPDDFTLEPYESFDVIIQKLKALERVTV